MDARRSYITGNFGYLFDTVVMKKRMIHKKFGFTLIETVVVVALLGMLGIVATNSLVSLLRSSSRTELNKEIKQNGDYVLSVMESKIRSATGIINSCTGVPISSITVRNKDTSENTFTCDSVTRRIYQDGVSLTSSDVRVNSCNIFICNRDTGCGGCPAHDVVIDFTLTQPNPSAAVPDQASQQFKSKVVIRSYNF